MIITKNKEISINLLDIGLSKCLAVLMILIITAATAFIIAIKLSLPIFPCIMGGVLLSLVPIIIITTIFETNIIVKKMAIHQLPPGIY